MKSKPFFQSAFQLAHSIAHDPRIWLLALSVALIGLGAFSDFLESGFDGSSLYFP